MIKSKILNCFKIKNSHSIFQDIDQKINKNSIENGFVELIFTKPDWRTKYHFLKKLNFNSHTANNPYGHVLVRYKWTDFNSEDKIMNVSGQIKTPLINFFEPNNYFFNNKQEIGNEQGGIYRRSFLSIRIDSIPSEKIYNLDCFYKNLGSKHLEGQVKFTMISHTFMNPIKKLFGLNYALGGNCSYYTGLGLKELGLIKETSSFPLVLWFKLLLNQIKNQNNDNLNIISYRSINFNFEPKGALLYPFFWIKNSYHKIWNLEKFANIIIQFNKIDDSNYSYNLTENQQAKQNILNNYKEIKKYINY